MKKKYFKFVEIDKNIIVGFLNKHPELKKFIQVEKPFYVRVGIKPYPTLIHNIICQDVSSVDSSVIANSLVNAAKKISARRIYKLTDDQLVTICNGNKEKALLIKNITIDALNKTIDLKHLVKSNSQTIIDTLSKYQGLKLDTIKQFALFGCFKQDILCEQDPDFISGLKIYLNKKDINKQDIINIETQFSGQLTLFSLCMWRINNERTK